MLYNICYFNTKGKYCQEFYEKTKNPYVSSDSSRADFIKIFNRPKCQYPYTVRSAFRPSAKGAEATRQTRLPLPFPKKKRPLHKDPNIPRASWEKHLEFRCGSKDNHALLSSEALGVFVSLYSFRHRKSIEDSKQNARFYRCLPKSVIDVGLPHEKAPSDFGRRFYP